MIKQKASDFKQLPDIWTLNQLTRAAAKDLQKQQNMYGYVVSELDGTHKQIGNLVVAIVKGNGNNPCGFIFNSKECDIYKALNAAEDNLDSVINVIRTLHSIFVEKVASLIASNDLEIAVLSDDDTKVMDSILALPDPY